MTGKQAMSSADGSRPMGVCLLTVYSKSFIYSEGSQAHESKASQLSVQILGSPAMGPLHSVDGIIMRQADANEGQSN